MDKVKVRVYILAAFALGMIQIVVLGYIPKEWVAPYFALMLLVDVTLGGMCFHSIDNMD